MLAEAAKGRPSTVTAPDAQAPSPLDETVVRLHYPALSQALL
ncbi:hypothetical protein OG556_37600 (plasmid) [Kitasatospora sp. NBC_01300]|nr:hypothetical protein OG556_37600 [Kitasatospora sp. NBC_01300]